MSSTVKVAKTGAGRSTSMPLQDKLLKLFNKYDWGKFTHPKSANPRKYSDSRALISASDSPIQSSRVQTLPSTVTKRGTRNRSARLPGIHATGLDNDEDLLLMSALYTKSPTASPTPSEDVPLKFSSEKENSNYLNAISTVDTLSGPHDASATPRSTSSPMDDLSGPHALMSPAIGLDASATPRSTSSPMDDLSATPRSTSSPKGEYDFLDDINNDSEASEFESPSICSNVSDDISNFIVDSDSDQDEITSSYSSSRTSSVKHLDDSVSDDEDDYGILQYSPPRPPKRVPKGTIVSSDTLRGRVKFDDHLMIAKSKLKEKDCISDKDFVRNRIQLARNYYEEFNSAAFASRLPEELSITWHKRMLTTAGRAWLKLSPDGSRIATIELSEKVTDTTERLRSTLLHEMCHVAAWLLSSERKPPHGPKFWHWATKAEEALGTPVNRCHSYAIHKPHRFECTTCKHSYMRHSKSIDTESQVCGRCRGRLVYTGNFNKDGTPKKPRAATAFSMFVKENFANVKKKNSGKSHAETMQELSRMFKGSMNICHEVGDDD